MRRNHAPIWGAVLAGAAGLVVCSAPGSAQGPLGLDFYSGAPVQSSGLRLAAWGSGSAAEDRTYRTAGGEASIKVDTNGYYAGARLIYNQPRDITAAKNDPHNYLGMTVRFQPGRPKPQRGGGTYGGYPGGPGGGSGGSSGGPGYPGGGSGGSSGGPGYPGGPGGYPGGPGGYPGGPGGFGDSSGSITPDTRKMKIILVCDEGSFVATNYPVQPLVPSGEDGWYSVAVPFVAFKGLPEAKTANLREIRVFGDNKDTFWIGDIKTIVDDEPITVDPLENLEVSVNEPVEFYATANGGLSPLKYQWDFNKADGIQEEDTGPVVVHTFRKPSEPVPGGSQYDLQPYVVTLTVQDVAGAKKKIVQTVDVIVNP
ncbi:MAG: hypothetical protein ACK47B_05355 [Armatimonadota bacterium]